MYIISKMTTFSKWKKPFLKDRVCKNQEDIQIWLKMRGITEIPFIVSKYNKWVCKSSGLQKVCLIRHIYPTYSYIRLRSITVQRRTLRA